MTEVKCAKCGTINVGGVNCRLCGHPLHSTEAEVRACPKCGSTATPIGKDRCVSCGWSMGPRPVPHSHEAEGAKALECETMAEGELHTVRSFTVDLAAIFMIVSGALGVFHAVLAALPGTSNPILSTYGDVIPAGRFLNDVLEDYVFVSVIMFAFGALCIALSVTVVNRSSFGISLIGASMGILSIGFFFGAFFGLMALVLLLISRREYLLECAS